jgi:hypothetical protein
MSISIRKNFNSNCALEFARGGKWTKYIAHTCAGPRVHHTRIDSFDQEFKEIPGYDPRIAALRFLDAAKRAYEHDDEVLSTLMEIIMGKPAKEMSVAELVVAYNDLAKTMGKAPRKSFKSKAEGLKAIETLDAAVKKATPAQKVAEEKKEAVAEKRKADKPKTEAKPKGQGVGAFCKDLIGKGRTNQEILTAVQDKFPGAKTSAGCIAYYRNKLKAQ